MHIYKFLADSPKEQGKAGWCDVYVNTKLGRAFTKGAAGLSTRPFSLKNREVCGEFMNTEINTSDSIKGGEFLQKMRDHRLLN